MDSRKQNGHPGVRRRLNFDDGAPEWENRLQTRISPAKSVELTLEMNEERLKAERKRAAEKWNFDFENEVPLDGDWEWEKVETPSTEARNGVRNETDSNRKARNA
ncbi:unnamed protein product [Acanthoscelides obtectus]|uniref:Cyclin-dependent kinase inhibitor domain-containing protein n=1 Tax=Acanthoscelides obtectus TaxID=200917 RepID=A0A9P0KHY1_ACAOB|nr:unnamed protein product [Acanthoscelides obtectus]CAK1631769.1 hypothetical protein AOBTE_LOCUS7145 [Acanthoscelides obtectus]